MGMTQREKSDVFVISVVVFVMAIGFWIARSPRERSKTVPAAPKSFDQEIEANAERLLEAGRQIFRFDTFGSEDFWGGKLRLHESLAGEKLGGVGNGVSPKTALPLGLKVDAEALPASLSLRSEPTKSIWTARRRRQRS